MRGIRHGFLFMVQPADWYSLISVSTSAVALGLAAYVLRKIPNRRAGDTFVLAMTFFLLAAVSAYLLRISDPWGEGTSLILAHTFYFFHMLAVGFTAAFIGSYFYGFKVMGRRSVVLFLQITLFASAFVVSTLVTAVESDPSYGVTVDSPNATLALAVLATAFMSTALGVLVRTLYVNKDPVVRKQVLVMLAGILIHGAGAESYAYLKIGLYTSPPPFLTITALAMAGTFALAILRFKMFTVTPRKEERLDLPSKFPLQPGHAYVVEEAAPRILLRAFDEAVRGGQRGLLVTRRNPAAVREGASLSQSPILWLTEMPGQNHVAPGNPAMLLSLVAQFVRDAPKGIVALDGVEAMSGAIGRGAAETCLQSLKDLVVSAGGVFLVSVTPTGNDTGTAAFFEREFEVLRASDAEATAIEDLLIIEATTGILLARKSRGAASTLDSDLLAGMLTAIMDFTKTSFAQGDDQLRDLILGERKVALERGARMIVAAVFRGRDPPDVHPEIRAFMVRAESAYGPTLTRWNGDIAEMRGLEVMASRLFPEPGGAGPTGHPSGTP